MWSGPGLKSSLNNTFPLTLGMVPLGKLKLKKVNSTVKPDHISLITQAGAGDAIWSMFTIATLNKTFKEWNFLWGKLLS